MFRKLYIYSKVCYSMIRDKPETAVTVFEKPPREFLSLFETVDRKTLYIEERPINEDGTEDWKGVRFIAENGMRVSIDEIHQEAGKPPVVRGQMISNIPTAAMATLERTLQKGVGFADLFENGPTEI